VLAVAGGAYAVYEAMVPEHRVPNLVKLTLADARKAVVDEDFDIEGRDRFSESVPKGQIIEQDPPAGEMLREGGDVKVVVSGGPPPTPVPDLAGQSQETAAALLADDGFKAKFDQRYDEAIPKGRVIDWNPKGSPPKGSEISVVLSQGPAPRPVPNVAGKSYDEAATMLKAAGFAPARAEVFHDTVPVGTVVGTSPGAGAKQEVGGKVTVNVSKGPQLVPIPDVRGKNVIEATNILQAAGFVVSGTQGPANKPVTNTSPAPGTPRPRGSEVGLYTK
jgi:serine/threonine-protein kinase